MCVHTGIEAESQAKPRGSCDEYDSHVCPSGTVINYLRCFKASWWLLPFLIPGDRLGWSGWAFVTDRTDMNTPKLSSHWGQRLLQTHTQERTYLFSISCNGWRQYRGPYAIPPRLLPSDTADDCSRSHTHTCLCGGMMHFTHIFHSCAFRKLCPQTNKTPPLRWIKCGGKTIAGYWLHLAQTPLRGEKKGRNRKQTHTQTAICHGCWQLGHHLPPHMGQKYTK